MLKVLRSYVEDSNAGKGRAEGSRDQLEKVSNIEILKRESGQALIEHSRQILHAKLTRSSQMRLKSENYDVESKNRADRNSHAQEGENMKDQSDEMSAETEQWKEVVGNLQILQ